MRTVVHSTGGPEGNAEAGLGGPFSGADGTSNPALMDFTEAPLQEEFDAEVSETFWEMKTVEVSKIIPFPDALPELLKAA